MFPNKAGMVAILSLAFGMLLVLGFWVGAFESFGGYVSRKRVFLGASIGMGLAAAWLLNRKWKVHYAEAGAFLLLSHCAYLGGQALGQTYYFRSETVLDFVQTFWLAMNNAL